MIDKDNILQDEINLILIIKSLWTKRTLLIKVIGAFLFLGLIVGLTSPVEYEASSKLLPESQESSGSNLGGLGSLAGLAGINLNSMSGNSNSLSPTLYPEIVNSLPFILEAINDTLLFEQKNLKVSSYYYFKEIATNTSIFNYLTKYTIGLPGLIKQAMSNNNGEIKQIEITSELYRIPKKDWKIIESFKSRILVSMDKKTGIISISVQMPDPFAAAQLAKKIEKMITAAVIKYKTDRATINLEFINKTFNEAKNKFEIQQLKLARANDRNRNVSSSMAQIELQNIENEYNVAFDVYKGLASQVEQAKIKLKEETPVFTILEPVRIPEQKSKPKRLIILVVFGFIGALFSSMFIAGKVLLNYNSNEDSKSK